MTMPYALPQAFLDRMQMMLSDADYNHFIQQFSGNNRLYFVLNPFKNNPDQTISTLEKLCIDLKPHPEIPLFGELTWSIDHQHKSMLTYHEMHNLGYFYLLGLPSILTVAALNPKPNDTILDLTAAPGGKTFLMAILMHNTGQIVANDQSKSRFFKLIANLERLNITNVNCRLSDGRKINKTFMAQFDKVLLDAPCSCESRFNVHIKKTLKYWGVNKIKACVGMQKQLILNAFRACKPGGQLVYSTCTFSPEENEGIMCYLKKKHPSALLQDIELPYGRHGVATWEKYNYPQGQKTLRILPNKSHTGGCISKVSVL
ncbi:MAG: RsmB/NOP family class I SAM-dependent RNA methyltransferase [Pseudomonadota bacterium]|nr:RsmB/NOP family class I SAM-dependent RNA methyltransferase [Pseudomonadota bacterium]